MNDSRDFAAFSDSRGEILDASMLRSDLATLKGAAKKIMDFADKRVAHLDRKASIYNPTFDELHECISIIDGLGVFAIPAATGTPMGGVFFFSRFSRKAVSLNFIFSLTL